VGPERVGSDSAPDDSAPDGWAAPRAVAYCGPVAQDDSPGDEAAQADCSAESAGGLVELQVDGSPPAGCSVDSSRDDYSAAPRAADSAPGDCSEPVDWVGMQAGDLSPAGCSADSSRDDYSAEPRAADSAPGDCLEPVDWVGPQAGDLSPADCSVVPQADDSAVRARPRPDVRSELADFPAGLPVG
jgi:hypothetical protein